MCPDHNRSKHSAKRHAKAAKSTRLRYPGQLGREGREDRAESGPDKGVKLVHRSRRPPVQLDLPAPRGREPSWVQTQGAATSCLRGAGKAGATAWRWQLA